MIFTLPRQPFERFGPRLPMVLLATGVMAVLAGILLHQTYLSFPTRHSATLLVLGMAAWTLSLLLRRFFNLPVASGLALVWAAALLWMAGSRPVLAAVLMLAAAAGLGARLVPVATPARPAIAIVTGLAVMAGGLGWVLSVRGHGPWLYFSAMALLAAMSRRELQQLSAGLVMRWSAAVNAAPGMAGLAVMTLGLVSVVLWLPDLMYDDLAYHLALPVQLAKLGYYRLDPATQVWALAPWAGDLVQAIVQVVSGEAARGAVNALWLLLSGVLLWCLGREIGLDASRAWLTVALYASMPLSAILAFGQQTEGPSIVVLLALALVILRAPPRPEAASLQLVAVLLGLLLALKLSNVLSAVPMGLWLLARWRCRLPWRAVPAALALLVLIGGSSYFHAWALAGNPVLPLFNDVFLSEFMLPERFHDGRWNAGLDWALVWRLTFDTSRYIEAWPGAAGFLLVGLAGALPLALCKSLLGPSVGPSASNVIWPLALVGLAAFLLPLLFVQYLRYTQPGLVLLLPLLVAGLQEARPRRWVDRLLIALVVLNLGFHGSAHWALYFGALSKQVLHGRTAVMERFAPEAQIAEWLHRQPLQQARILLVDRDRAYIAPFAGQAFARNWYDLEINTLAAAADDDPGGGSWRQTWFDLGITHVLTAEPVAAPVQAGLAGAGAEVVYAFGDTRLWQLPVTGARDLMRERDLARQRLLGRWLFP